MNLDPRTGAESSYPPLAPPEWTMEIAEAEHGYRVAVLACSGKPMYRISLHTEFADGDAARSALAIKARLWIAEYLARDHSGSTSMGDI